MWHREFQQSLSSSVATSLVGRAVADANWHPSDRLHQFKPVKKSLTSGVMRSRDSNLATIRQTLMTSMKKNCCPVSRTWLEACSAVSRDAVTTTLPFASVIRLRSSSRQGRHEESERLDSVLRQTNEYSSGEGRRNLGERNKDGTFVGMWKIAHVWNTSNTSYNETAPAHAQVNATEHLSIMADDEDEISGWS